MIKSGIALLITLLVVIGCSTEESEINNIAPKLVIGQTLSNLELNDQFEKQHSLNSSTKTLIFAFEKKGAHICNDFFNIQESTYLEKHNTQFVADVSSAPSVIRSLFIMPGLKDFKHTVLLLEDKVVAKPFRKNIDIEKIIIVSLNNKSITKIQTISTTEELKESIEKYSF